MRHRSRQWLVFRRVVPGVVTASMPLAVSAQGSDAGRPVAEVRIDATLATPSALHLAGGLQFPSGTYVRMALLGGLGRAWEDSAHRTSARLEGQARFHLDPYRASRLGLYGLGGVAVVNDETDGWSGRLVLGLGLELPATGRATWAVEGALAGGFRLTLALRGARPGRR